MVAQVISGCGIRLAVSTQVAYGSEIADRFAADVAVIEAVTY
jgi:hypothetical protein